MPTIIDNIVVPEWPSTLTRYYRSTDWLNAVLGDIDWSGTPSINQNGVAAGHGPSLGAFEVGDDGLGVAVKVKMTVASTDVVGDVQICGPFHISSSGVKLKVGESSTTCAESWGIGDTLVLSGHFIGGEMRVGVLAKYLAPSAPVEQPDSGRSIKTASLPYGAGYLSDTFKEPARVHLAEKFDFMVGGGADVTYNPANYYATYLKSNYYPDALPAIKSWCELHGVPYEDMFNHISIDYTAASLGWKERDKYTVYLGTTNKTTDAYKSTVNTTINNDLYIGHESPFDQVNITIATAGAGIVPVHEYWNGSAWATLTVVDTTSAWTQSGSLRFTPPANWAERVMNAEVGKAWWVRVRFTSVTTAPIVQKIYGDDWYTNGMCRGWDATSSTIINDGTPVAYNPTPPAGATAKFRHQGRVTGYWTTGNLHLLNFDFEHDGDKPACRYVADDFCSILATKPNVNAIMWDTAFSTGLGVFIKAPTNAQEYCESTYSKEVQMARFAYVRDVVKQSYPNLMFGGNNYGAPVEAFEMSEWGLLEYYEFYVPFLGKSKKAAVENPDKKYSYADGYLPENNPNGIKGMFLYCDGIGYNDQYIGGFWDRGNRGPMLALCKHYIVGNENTYFGYHSQSGYRYDFSDEVLYYKYETTLSESLTADTSNSVKTVKAADFSKLDRTELGISTAFITSQAFAYGIGGLQIRIGDDSLICTKVDNNTITTTSPIYSNHAPGERVRFVGCKHLGVDPVVPAYQDVWKWNWWFPAMDVNIGTPDPEGHNGGVRDFLWKTAAEIGGADDTEIWRRDFTWAIVLLRSGANYNRCRPHYITPCAPIPLGQTYYPLFADGTVGSGITSIQLRAGEGAILLKAQP